MQQIRKRRRLGPAGPRRAGIGNEQRHNAVGPASDAAHRAGKSSRRRSRRNQRMAQAIGQATEVDPKGLTFRGGQRCR